MYATQLQEGVEPIHPDPSTQAPADMMPSSSSGSPDSQEDGPGSDCTGRDVDPAPVQDVISQVCSQFLTRLIFVKIAHSVQCESVF